MTVLAHRARACAVALTLALVLTACGAREQAPAAPPPILVDGSSTVSPLTKAVVQSLAGGADAPIVAIAESGTAAGFAKFCAGEIDIAGASRPIQTREMIACFRAGVRYVEAPVAFDGLIAALT